MAGEHANARPGRERGHVRARGRGYVNGRAPLNSTRWPRFSTAPELHFVTQTVTRRVTERHRLAGSRGNERARRNWIDFTRRHRLPLLQFPIF